MTREKYSPYFEEVLLPLASRSGTDVSDASTGYSNVSQLKLYMRITVASSGTLSVWLEESADGTNWTQVGNFPATSQSTGILTLVATNQFADRIRLGYQVNGSATFEVIAVSKTHAIA